MGNHASACKLWNDRTIAWLSYQPRRLLFFVHGFGGQNVKTWLNFPALMLNDARHARDDLVFYGYESRRQPAKASAGLLLQRCNELLSRPERYQNSIGLQRSPEFSYEEIVFLSHSLGAPVVRHMLLQARQLGCPWANHSRLIFFAPATAGARINQLRRLALAPSADTLGRLLLLFWYRWPVIDDLVTGSPFLSSVRDRTLQALQGGATNLQSVWTGFGSEDGIINLNEPDLPFDAPYLYFEGCDHNNVCKPRKSEDRQFQQLAEVLEVL